MKKIMMITGVIALVATMSGCATQTYHINGGSATTPTADKMQNFFVSGLGQTKEMDAAKICGGADKIIKVESKHEFVDGVLGVLTWGIYTPRHAKVYCKK